MRYMESLILILLFTLTACTIYQSPERKSFESESPTFKIQSLQKISCSSESVQSIASQSRLMTVHNESSLWEHIVENKSIYESNELNKEYCIYENKK
jgi:hypothetical protein